MICSISKCYSYTWKWVGIWVCYIAWYWICYMFPIIYTTILFTDKHIIITITIYVNKDRCWIVTNINWIIITCYKCPWWRRRCSIISIIINIPIMSTNKHVIITVTVYINKSWRGRRIGINWIIIICYKCPWWRRRSSVISVKTYGPIFFTNKHVVITISIYINKGWMNWIFI